MIGRDGEHTEKALAFYVSTILLLILTGLSVILRFYSRWLHGWRINADDYTMVGALVSRHDIVNLLRRLSKTSWNFI